MKKKTYLLGSLVLGIVSLVAVMIVLIATGVIGGSPRKIVFTSASAQKVYDGEALVANEYKDAWLSSGELKEGHRYEVTVLGSQTNAGSSDNAISVKIFDANDADVTESYDIEYQFGTLTVNPRSIKITASSASKQYDTEKLECKEWSLVDGEVLKDHVIEPSITDSRTEVGESDNTISARVVDLSGNDVSSNYDITYVAGKLLVTPHIITIESTTAEKIYDAKPLTFIEGADEPGYSITAGGLLSGHKEVVVMTGAQTEVGSSVNTFGVKIVDENGNDVTNCYKVTSVYGELTVTKKDVTVESGSAEKIYDARPLTLPSTDEEKNYTITAGEIVEGHKIILDATGTQTDAGESENTFGIEIVDAEGNSVTQNYNITSIFGTLKVTPLDVIIESNGAEKVYDRLPLVLGSTEEEKNYQVIAGSILEEHTLIVNFTGTQTEVGQSDNTFGYEIVDENDVSVTHNYNVKVKFGQLIVKPVQIIVESADAEKIYDKAPLFLVSTPEEPNFSITGGALLSGDEIIVTLTGSQTDAGESENTFGYTIVDEEGNDVTRNYSVKQIYGTLTVKPIKLTIVSEGDEKVYDGKPLYLTNTPEKPNYSIIAGALLDGHTIEIEFTGTQTEVGESENTFSYRILNEDSREITGNYEIRTICGRLVVKPIEISISSNGATKVYDRTALSLKSTRAEPNFQIVAGALMDGHEIEVTFTGKQIDAGTSDNTFACEIFDSEGNDVTRNYNITKIFGELTVVPLPISVKSNGATKIYDGNPLTQNGYEVVSGALLDSHYFVIKLTGRRTDAGTSDNTFSIEIENEDGKYVTSNYSITKIYGELTVDPIEITITSANAQKQYDSKPLKLTSTAWMPNYTVVGSLLSGHNLTVDMTGELTDVGEASSSFAYKITDTNGKNVTKNYKVRTIFGTLKVTTRPITLISGNATGVYGDAPVKNESVTDLSKSLLPQHTLVTSFNDGATEVGEHKNTFTCAIKDGDKNISANYDITYIYGTLTVTKRPITITSADASKIYDGQALTNSNWKVTSTTKPVSTHTVSVAVTGTITDPGQKDNAISEVIIYDRSHNKVTHNYEIKTVEGLLTVYNPDGTPPTQDDGNGDGDGNSDSGLNKDGSIGSGGGTPDMVTVAFKVKTNISTKILMRNYSYGAYVGKGWNQASDYNGANINGTHALTYLAGIALENSGYSPIRLDVQHDKGTDYVLPSYMSIQSLNYQIQTSDRSYMGNVSSPYAVYYYDYNGVGNGISLPAQYSAIERQYRAYVYNNYLDIPETTRAFMQEIIAAEGFSADDPDILEKVQAYIMNSAKYNIKYDTALDNEDDIAVAFLSEYKEGICGHYATAATVLLRALGIPARYTMGYSANTVAGEWTEVKSGQAHAWTEVYVDGIGWIALDVTGVGDGDDEDDTDDDEKPIELKIYPHKYTKQYDGEPLYAPIGTLYSNGLSGNEAFTKLIEQGYTYEVTFKEASITDPGEKSYYIDTFKLFDNEGNNVTSKYSISYGTGKLQVHAYEVTVTSPNISAEYTGSIVTSSPSAFTHTALADPSHSLEVYSIRQVVNAGVFKNTFAVRITDGDGNDITSTYKVNYNYGTITVEKRDLTIVAGSYTWAWDFSSYTEYRYQSYSFGDGTSLVSGDRMESVAFSADSVQIGPGTTENIITSVKIVNAKGDDVTSSYAITIKKGTLTVNIE